MKQLAGFTAVILLAHFASQSAHAVVIDDFTVGAYDATVPIGIHLDPLTQSNLDPVHVVGGKRTISFGTYGFQAPLQSSVRITIDTTEGVFHSAADPEVTPVNLSVRYGDAAGSMDVDLKDGGANALLFDFVAADFSDIQGGQGFFDVFLQSGSGAQLKSVYFGAGIHNSTTPFTAVIPFSDIQTRLPTVDLSHISGFSFGTGNGNLFGTFKLDTVRTTFVHPGDFNLDGAVDGADYDLWKSHYGGNAFPVADPADGNHDGAVDSADYTIWRDNLQAANAAAQSFAPEPPTWLVAVVALGLLPIRIIRRVCV